MKKNKTLSIAENIRSLREKRGYSQEYMSEILNVSQQTYSLTEKNPERASLERIQKIAQILEVKISFLLDEEDSFVLNNFNQQGGHAVSMLQNTSNDTVYQKMIEKMESEIIFLRNLVETKK